MSGAGPAATQTARLRLAEERDVPALEELIPLSVRSLQAATYAPSQIEGALGTVFVVDHQLIADGTYFVAERGDKIVGCGGWSRHRARFGGDHGGVAREDTPLDPMHDAARVRAFFVHPACARQGVGRLLMAACERAAVDAGFHKLELVATLAGEQLYLACAFRAVERFDVTLSNGLTLPVVRMVKTLTAVARPPAAGGGEPERAGPPGDAARP